MSQHLAEACDKQLRLLLMVDNLPATMMGIVLSGQSSCMMLLCGCWCFLLPFPR